MATGGDSVGFPTLLIQTISPHKDTQILCGEICNPQLSRTLNRFLGLHPHASNLLLNRNFSQKHHKCLFAKKCPDSETRASKRRLQRNASSYFQPHFLAVKYPGVDFPPSIFARVASIISESSFVPLPPTILVKYPNILSVNSAFDVFHPSPT